ncbi:MAG TPA: hypothetical protein PK808_08815, partial [Polymorphobacter sp.]|nr:hypothetical protein [Polymorphobacter sp.]
MTRVLTTCLTLALLAAPVAAFADDHGKGHGNNGKHHGKSDGRHDNGNHYGDRDDDGPRYAWQGTASSSSWKNYRYYSYNRPAPGQTRYYANQYYRDGRYYQPRYVAVNERIYRGQDNRYYCRRS